MGQVGRDGRRSVVGFLALAGLPMLVLLDTSVALVRGWRLTCRLDCLLTSLAAAVLLVSCVIVAVPRGRLFLSRRRGQLLLLCVSVVVTCLTAEAAMQWYWRFQRLVSLAVHRRPPAMSILYEPEPGLTPGVYGASRFTTNSLGIRGPELPPRSEAYRILCIGGSTTECLYLDDGETWPHLLMQMLNREVAFPRVWVGNAGISGFASIHHLGFAEESVLMEEIDCLVVMAGVNDLGIALRTTGGGGWRLPGHARVVPLWARSDIVELARLGWHTCAGAWDTHVEDMTASNYDDRRRERREAPKCRELPDLDAAMRDYEARIRSIVGVCRERHVRPVFVYQPSVWKAGLSERGRALLWHFKMGDGQFLSVEKLREGMDGFNGALRETCAELDAGFIDLGALDGREELFYDDCHFNEAGAREVARLMSGWFLRRPVPTAPP